MEWSYLASVELPQNIDDGWLAALGPDAGDEAAQGRYLSELSIRLEENDYGTAVGWLFQRPIILAEAQRWYERTGQSAPVALAVAAQMLLEAQQQDYAEDQAQSPAPEWWQVDGDEFASWTDPNRCTAFLRRLRECQDDPQWAPYAEFVLKTQVIADAFYQQYPMRFPELDFGTVLPQGVWNHVAKATPVGTDQAALSQTNKMIHAEAQPLLTVIADGPQRDYWDDYWALIDELKRAAGRPLDRSPITDASEPELKADIAWVIAEWQVQLRSGGVEQRSTGWNYPFEQALAEFLSAQTEIAELVEAARPEQERALAAHQEWAGGVRDGLHPGLPYQAGPQQARLQRWLKRWRHLPRMAPDLNEANFPFDDKELIQAIAKLTIAYPDFDATLLPFDQQAVTDWLAANEQIARVVEPVARRLLSVPPEPTWTELVPVMKADKRMFVEDDALQVAAHRLAPSAAPDPFDDTNIPREQGVLLWLSRDAWKQHPNAMRRLWSDEPALALAVVVEEDFALFHAMAEVSGVERSFGDDHLPEIVWEWLTTEALREGLARPVYRFLRRNPRLHTLAKVEAPHLLKAPPGED